MIADGYDNPKLDDQAYRTLRARAALEGRTVGDLINEAIRAYLRRLVPGQQTATLRDLKPERFPKGNQKLSREIDCAVLWRQR